MRLRVIGRTDDASFDKCHIEQFFRLALGSWAGRLRRADVLLERREDDGTGLAFSCQVNASLTNWADVSARGLGADGQAAVRSATRHLVRHIRRHVESGCFPLGG